MILPQPQILHLLRLDRIIGQVRHHDGKPVLNIQTLKALKQKGLAREDTKAGFQTRWYLTEKGERVKLQLTQGVNK